MKLEKQQREWISLAVARLPLLIAFSVAAALAVEAWQHFAAVIRAALQIP